MPISLSVILTVYQKVHQIGTVIRGITANTTTPFQLVMVYDGCTDGSEGVVNRELRRCRGLMRDIKVVHTPDVNEVRANNAGMQAADGDHLVLVQDDMWIVEQGWERRLVLPLEEWDDVFAVSARNAHSFRCSRPPDTKVTYTCTMNAERDLFRIRDAVNRGPLALCAATMKRLNYLDEAYAPLYFDDMDLCLRAYRQFGKVCGIYAIAWHNLQGTVHVAPDGDVELSTGGTFAEASRKNRLIFWQRHQDFLDGTANHDEDRTLVFEPDDRMDSASKMLRTEAGEGWRAASLADLHTRLGQELLRKGRRQAAIGAFNNSLGLEPGNVAALTALGMLLWGHGDADGAVRCLTDALRVRPHARRPMFELVRILAALNKTVIARSLLETYTVYDPCDKEATELFEDLSGAAKNECAAFAYGGRR